MLFALVGFDYLLAFREHLAIGSSRGFPVRDEEDIQLRPRAAKVMANGAHASFRRIAPDRIAVFLAGYKCNTAARAVLGIPSIHDQCTDRSCMSFSVREQVGDLSAGFYGS